jgi:hypothetical protein
MLMQAPWRFAHSARLRALVLSTLDYCLSLRFESGNFPSSEKDDPDDRLVQWCHGAPGLAFACIKAAAVFGEAKYITAAEELGEVVWNRGLLKKGLGGLCHGIGGNAYVFLKLHEATGDKKHLERASIAQCSAAAVSGTDMQVTPSAHPRLLSLDCFLNVGSNHEVSSNRA